MRLGPRRADGSIRRSPPTHQSSGTPMPLPPLAPVLYRSLAAALSVSLLFTEPATAMSSLFPSQQLQDRVASAPLASSSSAFPASNGSFRLPTEFPPLPDLQPTPYETVTLSNGLKVFLMKDTEVPLVRGSLLVRGGTRADPVDQRGLSSFAASLVRLGGSEQHPQTGEQGAFDSALEDVAASIEGGAGPEALSLGFTALKEDAPFTLSLMAELLVTPALPAEKLEFIRTQAINSYMHRNDSLGPIPRREALKITYGPDSIFARQTTLKALESISLPDIRTFLDTWVRPDHAVLGIAGDFDPTDMKVTLESTLGRWRVKPGQPERPPSLPASPVPTAAAPKDALRRAIYVVDKTGSDNAVVTLMDLGIQLDSPDLFPLEVLNRALNGFSGKLFEEVRSKNGLAYSVSGSFETQVDHRGTLVISGDTNDPAAFIRTVEGIMEGLTKEPLTDKIVSEAKQRSANEFVFNFSSTSSQLGRLISYDLLGIPDDFLYKFKAGIERVSTKDTFEAAKRNIRSGQLVTVVGGDLTKILPGLQEIAKARDSVVIRVDVSKEPGPDYVVIPTSDSS